jgi:hypothetical protein
MDAPTHSLLFKADPLITGPGERHYYNKRGDVKMKLSEPKVITFWIAVLLGLIGVIAYFLPALNLYAFWLVLVGLIILVLGNLLKGL